MTISLDGRIYLEKSLAVKVAEADLSPEECAIWKSYGFTFRSHCHYNKVYAVWEHTAHGPVIVDSLTVTGVYCDTSAGFSGSLRNSEGQTHWVKHSPERVLDLPVFAHVPFMPEITYLPKPTQDAPMQLKFPLVFKTQGNPNYLTEGFVYVTQIGEFRANYPQFGELRL